MAAIEARQVVRTFGDEVALDGLDLDIEPGEIVALLGPNGAGKTTTIRLLNGILLPDSGSTRVLGLDPASEGNLVRARTGVLTEHAGLDDRLTTDENLRLVAGLRGMSADLTEERIETLLDQFGIANSRHRLTNGFSTGQRKRVALARALLDDPEVLFLDEPTSGLDPTSTREVTELIEMLAAERGRTIVLCTHVLAEAERLPARIVVLEHGSVLANGHLGDLVGQLWSDVPVEIELGRGCDGDAAVELSRRTPGVTKAAVSGCQLRVRVGDRDVVPVLMRELIGGGHDVFEAAVRTPCLEDVYFEVLSRSARASTPAVAPAEPTVAAP